MASVRASVMYQAQNAARRLTARTADGAADEQIVSQLIRCAQLSQDARRTLDWARDTLRAHATSKADRLACQLLGAARRRIDAPAGGATDGQRPTTLAGT